MLNLRCKDKHFFLQYRPDSDIVHKHLTVPPELQRAWVEGDKDNNSGDMVRLYAHYQNLKAIDERKIPGAMAELGVWKGNSAKILHAVLPQRTLYLFDTFEGFDKRDLQKETPGLSGMEKFFKDTSLEYVRNLVGADDKVIYCEGWFPETTIKVPADEKFCFVHVDCDLGSPVAAALDYFYPRLSPGGIMIIHDYSSGWWKDVKPAVDAFMKDKPETPLLLPVKSGSVAIMRQKSGG